VDLDTAPQPRPPGGIGRPDDTGPPVTALYQTHGDLTPEMVGMVIRGHFTPLPGIPAGNMLAW
jgi:hypothetical protein